MGVSINVSHFVLLRCLHSSFSDRQKEWIMDVEDFLKVVSY